MLIELHPALVQFAVGLLLASVVLDALGVVLLRDSYITAGFYNLAGGAFFALAGIASGYLARSELPARPPAGMALLALHEVTTLAAFVLFAGLLAWRVVLKGRVPLRGRTLYMAFGFTAGLVLVTGAVIGAAMVYRHGLGVARSLIKPELLAP